jgi:hypothetical protein
MSLSQAIDDEDEIFLRRLIRPEEDRHRLHPTIHWEGRFRWSVGQPKRLLTNRAIPPEERSELRRLLDARVSSFELKPNLCLPAR